MAIGEMNIHTDLKSRFEWMAENLRQEEDQLYQEFSSNYNREENEKIIENARQEIQELVKTMQKMSNELFSKKGN